MMDSVSADGKQWPVQKPKMEIIMGKSEQFDQIMAEASKEEAAAEEAERLRLGTPDAAISAHRAIDETN